MQHGNKTRGTAVLGGAGMVALWGASSLIKSVQRGTMNLNAVSSNTATITAVNTANSVVRWLGTSTASTDTRYAISAGALTLTNATTVTFQRGGSTDSMFISYEVTEYNPGVIKSIQTGRAVVNNSLAVTVTEVNPAKSELTWRGSEGTLNPYRSDYEWAYSVLTNGTTITVSQGYVGGAFPYSWQLVEFF